MPSSPAISIFLLLYFPGTPILPSYHTPSLSQLTTATVYAGASSLALDVAACLSSLRKNFFSLRPAPGEHPQDPAEKFFRRDGAKAMPKKHTRGLLSWQPALIPGPPRIPRCLRTELFALVPRDCALMHAGTPLHAWNYVLSEKHLSGRYASAEEVVG